jgi:hypothetical protein
VLCCVKFSESNKFYTIAGFSSYVPKCLGSIVSAERKEEWNEMVMSMTSPFKAIILPGSGIWGLTAGPVFFILIV